MSSGKFLEPNRFIIIWSDYMGLIRPQKVKVKWGTKNKKHYESLGYIYTKMKDEFEVDVEDLTKNTYTLVECICDNCKKIFPQRYEAYNRYVKEDGKTYCNECGTKLFTGKGIRKTRLLKSKSYAQWLIDNYGENALELYWDYDKNTIDPWEICYKGDETIWIKCQEKDYHGSYETTCYNFVKGNRCPYCSHKSNKVHPLDSLKQDIINKHGEEFFNKVWSDKNTVNPSIIAPNSTIMCWWNCTEGKHEPYQRNCRDSKEANYKCHKCVIENNKGENHHRWNPNITQEERVQRRNIEGYNDFVKSVYKRDNYTCQCCKNSNTHNLNAHHLNGYNWFKEGRIDIDNAITLCGKCHKEFHDLYGKGNNTKEQFEEFLNKKHIDK